jgi:hypothetical protein
MEPQVVEQMINQASKIDWPIFWTVIGVGVTTIGIIYQFFRNFKTDINARMDRIDERITSLEERMFFLATGKTLAEAIMLEKMKRIGETGK